MASNIYSRMRYEGDGKISAADAMRSMVAPTFSNGVPLTPMAYFWWMCAFKYVWRWWAKDGANDIRKAIDCLERLQMEMAE